MKNIYERLDGLYSQITDERFREGKGLGNELGFYIFDYDPEDELIVRGHVEYLREKLNRTGSDVTIRQFDLYEVLLEILAAKGYLEKVFAMERKRGTAAILRPVKSTLRLTQENSLVVDYIRNRVEANDIVFLTGVGKVWPIIRSHTILNVLHPVLDHVPLVMFYPGRYSGQDLCLCNEIFDQNYYRAFRLVER